MDGLAWAGRPVGRIGACIDKTFDQPARRAVGWIGFFECVDDPETWPARLFDVATAWARAQGAETCVGPASFTLNDECGLLVENFDDPPLILTTENPPYYERLWTGRGLAAGDGHVGDGGSNGRTTPCRTASAG